MKSVRICLQIGTVCLLALPGALPAQPAAKSPTGLQACVGEVTDNRSTGPFFSECKVEVKFTGDVAADAGTVRRVRVIEAVDEVGRDLRTKEEDSGSSRLSGSGRSSGPLKAEIKLRNPSRNATAIKSLKGEVELFSPTEDNGAVLKIQNIIKHPAEPVRNETLAKYKVTLMYLTKDSYEAKKKELEAQQKAAGSDAGEKIGAAFGEIFKDMFGGMMSGNVKNAIQLYIKDPEKRVLGLEFQDGQGKPLKTRGSWTSDEFKQTELAEPLPADTQLVVQLAVPEAVKTYSFELKDIPLP